MSKERLEEIQKEVNYAYRRDGSISTKAVIMPIEHYEHLYEQAERVQELEEIIEVGGSAFNSLENMYINLEQQNKRYREALEYIAAGIPVHSPIDYENKARKALEDEE